MGQLGAILGEVGGFLVSNAFDTSNIQSKCGGGIAFTVRLLTD